MPKTALCLSHTAFSWLTRVSFIAAMLIFASPSSAASPNISSQNSEGWQSYVKDGITVEFMEKNEKEIPALFSQVAKGRQTIVSFFHKSFPQKFIVRVYPDRASLTNYWRSAWKLPDLQPECWMVASGTATILTILSPSAWAREACEHEASDAARTQMLITHELTHVFHGQMNPRPDFDGLDDIGWFIEGLAVYVSGQLEDNHLASASDAIAQKKAPDQLERAWSGRYRYGVSGSLLRYVDAAYGRQKIVRMLAGTSEAELLKTLGVTEKRLLECWRNYVVSGKVKCPPETAG